MIRFATLVVALVIGTAVLASDAEAIPSCMGAVGVAANVFLGGLSTAISTKNSFLSEFTNSHPEPATLLLLGSSLAAAGVAVRKRARRAASEQSA